MYEPTLIHKRVYIPYQRIRMNPVDYEELWRTPLFSILQHPTAHSLILKRRYNNGCLETKEIGYYIHEEVMIDVSALFSYFSGELQEDERNVEMFFKEYVLGLGVLLPSSTKYSNVYFSTKSLVNVSNLARKRFPNVWQNFNEHLRAGIDEALVYCALFAQRMVLHNFHLVQMRERREQNDNA